VRHGPKVHGLGDEREVGGVERGVDWGEKEGVVVFLFDLVDQAQKHLFERLELDRSGDFRYIWLGLRSGGLFSCGFAVFERGQNKGQARSLEMSTKLDEAIRPRCKAVPFQHQNKSGCSGSRTSQSRVQPQ
jgi:hypothetical protein